jgi:uncharacterized protein (TIGR02453 family)
MIQKTTLQFLKRLKKNNNKAWFDAHKNQYLEAREDFEKFVQKTLDLYCESDPSISGLQAKDCMFRIYKDVRFSKDKTPYKTHFSAAFRKGGKMTNLPGFYFQIAPNDTSYFGGGIWMPELENLRKVRQEIDYNFKEFQSILSDKKLRKTIGLLEDESALSRPPKGYTPDNPAIAFLKMRSFFSGAELSDDVVTSPKLIKEALRIFASLKPLVDFLTRAMD